ncbi:XrtA/PEP-CTERM system histidine kinase PrsK [Iodidimonas muriae]|uniref:XrtA/PEP-CTERM system histidine kinase PrsK n=1 Tax=Iodidimonas muriae TaxID=261467 RepID=UPI00166A7288|nr:XrtA/PEP-CTERM system histidine kinase PrsK [Iodidimonas muriae]
MTAFGFFGLAVLLLAKGWRNGQTRLFALAAIIHALWAVSQVILGYPFVGWLALVLHTAHFVCWALFLASLLPSSAKGLPHIIRIATPVLILAKIGALFLLGLPPHLANLVGQSIYIIDLLAIVITLAAVVGVFQAASEYERWALKFICIPLGIVFTYELFVHAQIFAVSGPRSEYFTLRGLLNLVAVPLLLIAASRHKFWRDPFFVSRQTALYSLTLIGIGFYLMLVALSALIIPKISAQASLPLQTALLFIALMLLLFLLSSGSARAKIKLFVARNFYARKYDYAHEWRRLMGTLSGENDLTSPLESRIIRACAEILEIPGGALWVIEYDRPRLQATWNYKSRHAISDAYNPSHFLNEEGAPLCLYGSRLKASPFARDDGAWVVVPLPHNQSIIGFLTLSKPRTKNRIDWEDEELVLLVARQCASFLAEAKAVASLEQTRQFARFNRQYAFVAHDIKNIISQLSVMLKNFDRHANNPEFQRDMHETIANSVGRLQKLIQRLSQLEEGGGSAEEPEDIAVHGLLHEAVAQYGKNHPATLSIHVSPRAKNIQVRVPKERFSASIGHLLSNALEASGEAGNVTLSLDLVGPNAIIDISDDGAGMTLDFIRDKLFAPFHSTKNSGFGVGAFQCREFAREQGGDLEVVSSPGSGTTMRLVLPALS